MSRGCRRPVRPDEGAALGFADPQEGVVPRVVCSAESISDISLNGHAAEAGPVTAKLCVWAIWVCLPQRCDGRLAPAGFRGLGAGAFDQVPEAHPGLAVPSLEL